VPHFTQQERLVLSVLAIVVFSGSFLQIIFKKYPHIHNIVNLIDSDVIYHKVDLNTASKKEFITIPYIGEYTAQSIIQYRNKNGLFSSIEEVKKVKGIREKNYEKFKKYLKVSKTHFHSGNGIDGAKN